MKSVPLVLTGLLLLLLLAAVATGIPLFRSYASGILARMPVDPASPPKGEHALSLREEIFRVGRSSERGVHALVLELAFHAAFTFAVAAGIVALLLAWPRIRRKPLALAAVALPVVLVVALFAVESFTGFLLSPPRLWREDLPAKDALTRTTALHAIVLPILLFGLLLFQAAVYRRLRSRAPVDGSPPPASGAPD